jgi:ankyrin repeat protein
MMHTKTPAALLGLALSISTGYAHANAPVADNQPVGDGWTSGHQIVNLAKGQFNRAKLHTFVGDLQCDGSAPFGNTVVIQDQVAHLLAIDAQNPYVWMAHAEAKLRAVELDCGCGLENALDAADKAVAIAPNDAAAYLTAAKAHLIEADVGQARDDIKQAKVHGASDIDIAYVQALVAQFRRDDKENISLLAPIVDQLDQSAIRARAYEALGDSYTALGQRELAEKSYRSGAVLNACVSSPQQSLAQFLLFEKADIEGARATLESLAQRLPSSETKHLQSVAKYFQLGNRSTLSGKSLHNIKDLAQSSYATPEDVFIEAAKFPSTQNLMKNMLTAHLVSDVDARDGKSNSALISAAIGNNAHAAQFLIEKHADIDAENGLGQKALGLFSARGNADAVKALLSHHADPDYVDRNGMSPLNAAVSSGHADVVELLLQAKTEYRHVKILPLISQAAWQGNISILQALLKTHTDINQSRDDVAPPLIAAIMSRSLETVKLLLTSKADAKVKFRGKTAADYARMTGDKQLIQLVAPPVT